LRETTLLRLGNFDPVIDTINRMDKILTTNDWKKLFFPFTGIFNVLILEVSSLKN